MKKIVKILIVCVISALLIFPFSSFAEEKNITYLGAFVGDVMVGADLDEGTYILSGLNNYNNTFQPCHYSSASGDVEFRFSIGDFTLMPGDVVRFSGSIGLLNTFSSVQLVAFNNYFSSFSAKTNFVAQKHNGTTPQTYVYVTFDITYSFEYSTPLNFDYISFYVHTSSSNMSMIPFDIQSSINNNPAFALNQQADKIIQGQQNATNAQTNENFGYSAPNAGTTTDGISAGGNLIDSLNAHIDNFNSSLGSNVDNLLNSIQGFKTIVHNIFDVFPTVLQYLVIFGLIFLILRKVVGR